MGETDAGTELTRLLKGARGGDTDAREALLGKLYGELHSMANAYLRRERAGHTLQPTALVHETYLKLFESNSDLHAESSGELMAAAARAMRQLLVDHARRRGAIKRGGSYEREALDDAVAFYEARGIELLMLNEALEKLSRVDEQLTRVVDLRFFGGRTNAETAAALGVSERTIERAWSTARAWLRSELDGEFGEKPDSLDS